MKATFSLTALFSIFILFSQNELDSSLKAIESQIYTLQSELRQLEEKKDSIKLLIATNRRDSIKENGIKTTINLFGASIISEPNLEGTKLIEIEVGDTVTILSKFDEKYYFVRYNSILGYISRAYIKKTDELVLMDDKPVSNSTPAYLNVHLKRNSAEDENRIKNKSIWIGMRTDQAIRSLGNPTKKNISKFEWGKHEQWIYVNKGLFLYFENGVLRSYQK